MLSVFGSKNTEASKSAFTQIPPEKFYRLINHGPCVLVTSGRDEKTNVAPLTWFTTVSEAPPMLALPIAERHYTAELIRATGEFTLNIPSEDIIYGIIYVGKSSGRNENKIKMAGLTPCKGMQNSTPYIGECIAHIECRVKDTHTYGTMLLFIADVLYAQVRQDLFDDYWITEKARTVHHLGNAYFARVGKRYKVR